MRNQSAVAAMPPSSHLKASLAAALILLSGIGEACAWGDLGHKVICEIALRRVAPNTRARIDQLISTDADYKSFADACAWPDHPRKRAPEHFLNLPRDSRGLTGDDCGASPACVITAIRKDASILASKQTTEAEKLTSLKFLGHWVGDVHQPLHVSFEDDRGGNSIRVTGGCQSNLHSAWDTCLVIAAVGSDVGAAASTLLASVNEKQASRLLGSSPYRWANESFAISENATTQYCHFVGNSCVSDRPSLKIDDTYIAANRPVVRTQLLKAGIRLAHLLDVSFAASR